VREITVDEYSDFLNEYAYLFNGGKITIDVVEQWRPSYRNWRELINRGHDVIPVFHIIGEKDFLDDEGDRIFKKYLDSTEHVAIGAIARLREKARFAYLDRLWKQYLLDKNGEPTHKIHGLGVTSIATMKRYPWYSVDSASCSKLALNGSIHLPYFKQDRADHDRLQVCKVSDQGNHDSFSNSYYHQPKLIQERIKEYCNNLGFQLAESIEGRVLKPRKSKPGETRHKKYSLEFPLAPKQENGRNLTSSQVVRECFNYMVFEQLAKNLTCKVYHACFNEIQITNISSLKHAAGFLISYAFLREKPKLFDLVKQIGGQNANQ
jgi:hypothetical protein